MSWCHPNKRTDNPHGRCCIFPFVYGRRTYNSCTKVAHHRLWCSLDKVYRGHWANCINPCTNNPCQNGGVCTVTGDDSYSCKCADEYFGNNCEKGLPCPPGKKTDNPHGRCCVFPFVYGGKKYESCTKVAHHRLWCSLDKIYKGNWANCVNPCSNNPCQNGGVCTVTGDDYYSCKCADGYFGDNCETGLPCPPGKKTDNPHGRCCVFPFVYGGKKYESCTRVAHHRLWCSLDKIYKGHWANCVNPCTNNPCRNGGVCTVTGVDSHSCKCADGYFGDNCETVSPCKSRPCKNGGTCTTTGADSFFCICTDEFEGDTCEKRLPCPPGKKTDNPHGRCCVFPFAYGGKKYESCTKVAHHRLWCSFDKVYKGHWANCVDECASSPCKNGASCKTTRDSYSCQPCPAGWGGENCQDIDYCESSPCKNGGQCVVQFQGYVCNCMDGFQGANCEEDINECCGDPCANGGTCRDQVGLYVCECPMGFTGKNCESAVDWKYTEFHPIVK